MTREESKKVIEVIQAYVNGEEIEYSFKNSNYWKNASSPLWNWEDNNYRVKPQPKYVPYDDVSEIRRDKWVKYKYGHVLYQIMKIDIYEEQSMGVSVNSEWHTLEEMFKEFEYEDGTAFGKLVIE